METAPKRTEINFIRLMLGIVLLSVILYFGSTLFVPLSFARLISFILYPLCKWLENHHIPRMGAIAISLVMVIIFFAAIIFLLTTQISRFITEWPALKDKLVTGLRDFSMFLRTRLHITSEKQSAWLNNLAVNAPAHLIPFLQKTIYASAVSSVLIILIPFYSALILFYRNQLVAFIFYIFPQVSTTEIVTILSQTITTFYNFIKGMAIVYLVVAILNSIGLAILGVPHAVLFGVIASVLTFIPYIGIMIGASLPIAVSWITYDSAWYPIGVVLIFTFVQYLEANVIFPLAVSYRLQVNTLFTLLAIVAGGILWGASGMILFIPFLGILKLIADHSERLKPVSLLLGVEKNNKKAGNGFFKRKVKMKE
jgi:predicted PurR-regulated permease PerM